jgi:excisionase family DNA binding protein
MNTQDRASALAAPVEHLLTSRELGETLGFSSAWVQDHFESGELPGFKIGGRLRFRESEVLAWLETKRAGTRGEAPATPHRHPPSVVSPVPAIPLRGEDDA